MMADLQQLARRMLADFDARTPGRFLEEPLDLSTAQAYSLQAEIAGLRERRGESVIGYKVGCTSSAIQAQVGVREPIFGRLFDTGSHPTGVQLSARSFAALAVEGEFAVRLSKDLESERVTDKQCRESIAEVLAVIELHHYVLPEFCPAGPWMIASNGLHAGLVLPGTDAHCPGLLKGARSISIHIDGVLVGSAEDEPPLARSVASLKWLAGRLTPLGLRLRRGQLILTGSSLPLYRVTPRSRVVVEAPPLGASCVEIVP